MGKTLLRVLLEHGGTRVPYSRSDGDLTEADLATETAEVKGAAVAMLTTAQAEAGPDPDREVRGRLLRCALAIAELLLLLLLCWLVAGRALPALHRSRCTPHMHMHKHPPAALPLPLPACAALGVWCAHWHADVLG